MEKSNAGNLSSNLSNFYLTKKQPHKKLGLGLTARQWKEKVSQSGKAKQQVKEVEFCKYVFISFTRLHIFVGSLLIVVALNRNYN